MAAVETVVSYVPADVRSFAEQNGMTAPARGRFSDALLLAYRNAGSPTYEREVKAERIPTVKVDLPDYDAGNVRVWALDNNVPVGSRGRIHPNVVLAWVEAGSPVVEVEVKEKAERKPVEKVSKVYPKVPLVGDGPHSERDFAASLGLALPNARGALPNAAREAVAAAKAKGMAFADKVNPTRPTAALDSAIDNTPLPDYDAATVRVWGNANGYKVGDRGRINKDVIWAWHNAGNVFVPKDVSTVETKPEHSKVIAPPASNVVHDKVRSESTAYVLWDSPRGGDVVGFSECAKCKRLISFCPCEGGPVPPSYIQVASEVSLNKKALVG